MPTEAGPSPRRVASPQSGVRSHPGAGGTAGPRRTPRRWLSREVFFPLAMKWDREPDVPRLMAVARRLASLSPQELEARQMERLRDMVEHARRRSPFHARRLSELGVDPAELRSPADLARLPLTTKEDIRGHIREMVVPGSDLVRTSTGGSTASPLIFYRDRACHWYRHAGTWEANRWIGWRPGDPWAIVWGARQDAHARRTWRGALRNALVENLRILDVSGATLADMREFLHGLRRHPVDILYGYTNALFELTNLADSLGLRMPAPRALVVTAEPLVEAEKQRMESYWDAPVYNRYASREFGVIAAECPERCGLHLLTDSLVVEILRPEGVGEDHPGEVVITDLVNRGMPFLRYPMGDATRPLGPSRCSLPYPVIAPVTGRASEFLITPDGRYVSGTGIIFDVLGERTAIQAMQLVQETRELVRVRVVPGPGYGTEVRADLACRLAAFLGEGMRLEFEDVEEIAREASGKLRFTICKVPTEWARREAPGPSAKV